MSFKFTRKLELKFPPIRISTDDDGDDFRMEQDFHPISLRKPFPPPPPTPARHNVNR